jgi:hypothetical protein
MNLTEQGAQKFCEQLIIIAEGVSPKHGRDEVRRPKQSKGKNLDKLQQQAIYLTTAVMNELQKFCFHDMLSMPETLSQISRAEFYQLILNTIYTALYSEFFYEDSAASRIYVDMISSIIPENCQPADLIGYLSKMGGPTFGR